jgi:cell filamentation protein
MSDDPYVYPGSKILRNKLGLRDAGQLEAFERRAVTQRMREGVPTGDFDLTHLRAVHGHLFQDVYDWAGEIRTVELSKPGSQFMFRQYIQNGMADVHRRIVAADYFKGAPREAFADEAARIIGDVNYVHPFREGNGRTQLLYLKQLSEMVGHPLDLRQVEPAAWLEGSKLAHQTDYASMSATIRLALERSAAAREPPREDAARDYIRERLAKAEQEPSERRDVPTKGRGRDR